MNLKKEVNQKRKKVEETALINKQLN